MFCEKFFGQLPRHFCRRRAVLHVAAAGIIATATVMGIKSVIGVRQHVNLYSRSIFSGGNTGRCVFFVLFRGDLHQRDAVFVVPGNERAGTV